MKSKDEEYWSNMKQISQNVLRGVLVATGVGCTAYWTYLCGRAIGFDRGCKFFSNITNAVLTAEERTEFVGKMINYVNEATPEMCRALFH